MGRTKRRKESAPGRGHCRGCLRDLFVFGSAGIVYCDACALVLRRRPGCDLSTLKNGRSERLPQERPIADRTWLDRDNGPRCRSAPIELFEYRELPNQHVPEEVRAAASVFCAACPVRAQCDAAATEHEYLGLWAGSWRYYTTSRRRYRALLLLDALDGPDGAEPAAVAGVA